jgi:hypothetical protein
MILAAAPDDKGPGFILVILQGFADAAMPLCAADLNVPHFTDMSLSISQQVPAMLHCQAAALLIQ